MQLQVFDQLMSDKQILYLHGFGSSGSSNTVTLLSQMLPQAHVTAPDIPVDPDEAMPFLQQLAKELSPDLIIGTSMGGMYAEQLHGYHRILVNPALRMGETMAAHGMVGMQTFYNPRQDGQKEFLVTKSVVKSYHSLCEHACHAITAEDAERVFGLFGSQDTVVDTYDMFAAHYPNAIHFDGGHQLTESVIIHSLIPVIRWVDDRQNQNERKRVFIDLSALRDAMGKARPSMRKVIEILISHYDVYFRMAIKGSDYSSVSSDQDWIQSHLGVPSFRHICCTSSAGVLYGDYLISIEDHDDFIGTGIRLGSPDFKTWDEIMVFFDRLSGQ